MKANNKKAVLEVLNSLEVIEENGGEDAYLLVHNNEENHKKLNDVGVSSEIINKYGDEETFCILALALSEGYAEQYNSSEGGLILNTDSNRETGQIYSRKLPTKEIQYAINLLENEIEKLKGLLENGHLLSDVRGRLQVEYNLANEAINQLREY